MGKPLFRTSPRRVLIISLRNLGDVILTTPLISSLKKLYPETRIDTLVFKNTIAILENNPDIHQVIGISSRPSFSEYAQILKRILRRYDLSVVTQTGDRPFIFSLLSSSKRIGVVPGKSQKGSWKRIFFKRWTEADTENRHTVIQLLNILDSIGGQKSYRLTPPGTDGNRTNTHLVQLRPDYAVLHICARYRYKQWVVNEWRKVADHLAERGMQIVLTGGPGTEETGYIAEFQQSLPYDVTNLAGETSLAELSEIIAGARLFVGLDTGTTHLAAATGVPVIAIFGPTNPVMWAPWPAGYSSDDNPFEKIGSRNVSNVWLVQGKKFCVPCHQEGCEKHRNSRSDCLDTLPAERVIRRIDAVISQK